VDEDFEMTAVELKSGDAKLTREIAGICRAPSENMQHEPIA
jgi:hypothetical protein